MTGMTKVFISYAHDDVEYALYLYNALKNCGVDVWMDLFDIPPGTQNWDRIIHAALRECSHLTLIHTQNSFDSDEVWSEWRQFLRYGKTVIPLITENVELPFRLNSVQFVDFYTTPFEEAFNKLLDAILVRFPTPPDWTGSSEQLPLSQANADSGDTMPITEHDGDVFDRLPSEQHNRIHWAEDIFAKQLIQQRLLEQYSRTLLNADDDETPSPRNNLIYFQLPLGHYLSHDLDCNLSSRQHTLADLLNHPTFIKPFTYLGSWPDSIQPSYPDDKNYLIAKYNYRLSDARIAPEAFTLSRNIGKYRSKSVWHESFFIPTKSPNMYSN
jgi:hypothetical protein